MDRLSLPAYWTHPPFSPRVGISSSDTTEGTVSPAELVFTTTNWNVAQTVTVTGVDDFMVDGNIGYTVVTAAATSTDPNYNGRNAPDVSVTNMDDDAGKTPEKLAEEQAWAAQKEKAEAAFRFWKEFLDLRMGPNHNQQLDAECQSRILCIVRAVSWVESRHGTGVGNQPGRDPMQGANPRDAWWKELTGQSGAGSRFVRGPAFVSPVGAFNASELPQAVKTYIQNQGITYIPQDWYDLTILGDKTKGHRNPAFSAGMSYFWAIPYLIHRTNTESSVPEGNQKRTFKCGDCSRLRLIKGAVAYNGGGDPAYESKIRAALRLIRCMNGE